MNSPTPSKLPRTPQAPDFETLIEAAGDLIYTLDLEGRFTFFNQAVERVLGYAAADLMGQPFTQFLTPTGAAVALRHYQQGLAGQEHTPFFEVEARHRDGAIVHLEIRAGMLMRDGVLVGRQGIARDINEIKALQNIVNEKSQRMTLLEERTRIAMGMYARIAELVYDDLGPAHGGQPAGTSEAGLREIQNTLNRVAAEKHGLNAADLIILQLLAEGRSNGEIAEIVCRSPHTVKDSVKKIMQRLGARRRAEAVACALKLGLLTAGA